MTNAVRSNRKRISFIFILGVYFIFSGLCEIAYAGDWALTLYGGRLQVENIQTAIKFQGEYEDSYLFAAALSRRVLSFSKYIDIELEVQAVKHFGDQDHWEFNGLPVIRWLLFPWDKYCDTSIAIGAGLSYATKSPPLEDTDNPAPNLLGYLMYEINLSLPKYPHWGLVMRFHHRSGADGFIGNIQDASNTYGYGIKYVF